MLGHLKLKRYIRAVDVHPAAMPCVRKKLVDSLIFAVLVTEVVRVLTLPRALVMVWTDKQFPTVPEHVLRVSTLVQECVSCFIIRCK